MKYNTCNNELYDLAILMCNWDKDPVGVIVSCIILPALIALAIVWYLNKNDAQYFWSRFCRP